MAEEWRRVAATLADPARRQVYASIVLGVTLDMPAKKRAKALAALVSAGLIHAAGDGYEVATEAFANLLAASPVATRTGIDRFVRDGRIEQYPVRAGDRLELLNWVRDRALPESAELSERELSEREFGERLAAITGDVATLRRHLVDAGLVVRDAAGQRYRRAE
jgi:hypothetical protein